MGGEFKNWWIVAQDPALRDRRGAICTSRIAVPGERLGDGPRGYRLAVVDYDASIDAMYAPWRAPFEAAAPPTRRTILTDPRFHAQNAFALAMRTLVRFERALGRRIRWAFNGQQLKIAPHAFQEANAFYSREDQALLFGYFPSRRSGRWIYTCLAHDVIVHETTHAIIDGLRARYLDPSHPDQAAFHEGFADTIALLSVFSLPSVVDTLLRASGMVNRSGLIARRDLTPRALRRSQLLGLADELGEELSGLRGSVLRRSAMLGPAEVDLDAREFREPHRRGEVLVAAMLDAFLRALTRRLTMVGDGRGPLGVAQVIDEASAAADTLLAIAIKALDYAPPVDLRLHDYLRALITSDSELRPDDTRFGYRDCLIAAFASYGVAVANPRWTSIGRMIARRLDYEGCHAESLARSAEEVHRFLWQNRGPGRLDIPVDAYTHVMSVDACAIARPDGFVVKQTVSQYKQTVHLQVSRLADHGLPRPRGMSPDAWLKLSGGGVLIFDEFGKLRFHIHQRVFGRSQRERLRSLEHGPAMKLEFRRLETTSAFAAIHERRADVGLSGERW
jgi:hypothetical protein